ncbi:MAG: hypothetical protein M1827_007582 [Pycnora praestabilis]|nr:MAG: hypothetical protein M1827_007582 [Pycnora praestabilis]
MRNDGEVSTPPQTGNDELVDRIRSLESLLQRHINTQASESPEKQALQTPSTVSSSALSANDQFTHLGSWSSQPTSPESTSRLPYNTGTLRVSETGYVQFLPRSSQWTSVLANPSVQASLEVVTAGVDDEVGGFPFEDTPAAARSVLLAILPPKQQCDQLIDVYFRVFSPLFHILLDPTFQEEYKRFQEDADSTSLSWLALLFVVISVAVTALDDDDSLLKDLGRGNTVSGNIKTLTARYRGAAMKCLAADGVLWRHNIKTLQALVLLTYAINHSHGRTWVLLGLTYNVALALGCHVDPENFDLNPIQCEERRRCWAGLMLLYTIQNTSLGNMDPQRLQHQVRLPADVNDVDIHPDGIRSPSVGPTQMSYILFKFRLYNISARICQYIFGTSEPSRAVVRALDHEITLEQQAWDDKYLADSREEALPVHHFVHLNILYGYSHQLFLLLHRPFFTRSLAHTSYQDSMESRNRCISSARALLDIHQMLCETPHFAPYKWFNAGLGSFHAFHAAVVLSVVLMDPQDQPQHNNIRSTLENTLSRFESLAYRSSICEKAAPVLRFLLMTAANMERDINHTTLHQSQPFLTPESNIPQQSSTLNWEDSGQMDALFDRLQPAQWLNPAGMAWGEWEVMMAGNNGNSMQS